LEPITIKDIAKALNISTSTVSRALRGSYEINPETKRLVIEYAEKMNYRPNPIALSLKENRSRAIGVIVPEIANNFFSQTINGIEAIAYNRGYHVIIFQSHESFEREVVNVQHALSRKVDGLLISLSGKTQDISHLKNAKESGMPVVMFDRVSNDMSTHKVIADNFDGGFQATEHLIKKGKRRIAYLASMPNLSNNKSRLEGYKAALEKNGIEFDDSLVRFCGFYFDDTRKEINDLLDNHSPEAFFAVSDRVALDCITAVRAKYPENPEKIDFVGFTNLKVAHLLFPPLTTIVQPALEIGQNATELLLDLIESKNKTGNYQTIKLPVKLENHSI